MTTQDDLENLDPAAHRTLTATEKIRSDAQFERIVAEPTAVTTPETGRSRSRRRVGVTAAAAAVAALLAGGVAIAPTAAYASWSAEPASVTSTQALQQAVDCTALWDQSVDWPAVEPDDILLSERRGDASLTIMRQGDAVIECSDVGLGGAGWSALTDETGAVPATAAGKISTRSLGSTGNWPLEYSSITGTVGAGVTGVDIVGTDGSIVTASVGDGWFTAWWPGGSGGIVDDGETITVHTDSGSATYDISDTYARN
jgi:hypothetical protein